VHREGGRGLGLVALLPGQTCHVPRSLFIAMTPLGSNAFAATIG